MKLSIDIAPFFLMLDIIQGLFGFVCSVIIGFGLTKIRSLVIFCILLGENLFHEPNPGRALP
jgi:hypothetical protein